MEDMEAENPPEAQRWTPAEAARFIAHVADDKLGLLFRVMVLSGGRRAEGCGFRWSGADLDVPYTDPETGELHMGAVLTVKRGLLQLRGELHEGAAAETRGRHPPRLLHAATPELLPAPHRAQ